MAGFARAGKFALVRVRMTIQAELELQPRPARLIISSRRVALVARDVNVCAGEWVASSGVIELRHLLPVGSVMTLFAFRTETPVMRIFVARGTRGGNA